MKTQSLGFIFMIFFALGCGKVVDANKLLGTDTIPADPVFTSISYIEEGATVQINAPIPNLQVLRPDLGSGGCAPPTSQIIFNGTYDATTIKTFEMTGVSSYETTPSAGTFQIKTCMAMGSAAVTLKALNEKGVANKTPLSISLNLRAFMTTVAAGHPTYPRPGFRALVGTTPPAARTSGTLTLQNFSAGDTGTRTLSSTGNTNLSMELGYVNILHQARPQD